MILTTVEEIETWMTAPVDEAMKLQRPLPGDALRIVARGEKSDPRPIPAEAALPPLREPYDGSHM